MIPHYISEIIEQGAHVVYGRMVGLVDEPISFYSGTFSGINSNQREIVVNPTDSRVELSQDSLDVRTDFLFRVDSEAYVKMPWVNNLRKSFRNGLTIRDQKDVKLLEATINAADQFFEISKFRKEHYALKDNSPVQV